MLYKQRMSVSEFEKCFKCKQLDKVETNSTGYIGECLLDSSPNKCCYSKEGVYFYTLLVVVGNYTQVYYTLHSYSDDEFISKMNNKFIACITKDETEIMLKVDNIVEYSKDLNHKYPAMRTDVINNV